VPVDHGGVIALAEQTGLTAYDASYLWVARHVNGPLVTLDDQLADAAQQG
jgi:predicted nucleic acid-binding protein